MAVLAVVVAAIVVFTLGGILGPGIVATGSNIWRSITPAASSTDEGNTKSGQFYTCGMHPWVILPEPGTCPICHMDLTPLDPEKFTGELSIDPVVAQNIGVRIEPVTSGPLVRTIRTVGTIDYDETTVRDVNIKVPGWIEKLYVDTLGEPIERGEPLFDLYSPDLYVAQEAYLRALQDLTRLGEDADPAVLEDARNMVESARIQLEYYDITPEQIDALAASGAATKTITVYSPHTGIVIAKHANEGMRLDPGMQIYRIADLTTVWVMVTLYEYQLPFVQEGQEAVMTLPYIPGQVFRGQVIYIYPYLDKATRQVNVRLEFENPEGLLKPGMYASIELKNTLAKERTLAPRAAVIDTGKRQVAFVSLGRGKFEPREVRMGVETSDGQVEILDGLRPGELVVTSGQFLLDSEANIRESLAKMIRGEMAADQETAVTVAGASELRALPDEAQRLLGEMLDAYFDVGNTLASDSVQDIDARARTIARDVDALLEVRIPDDEHFWHTHDEVATVRGKALEFSDAPDLEAARLLFADLSIALAKLTRATGVPRSYASEVHELHCPMYRKGQGGSTWLQPAGDVRNPFYGAVMLECFDERSVLPVTGGSAGEDDGARPDAPDASESPPSATAPAPLDSTAQAHIDAILSAYLAMHDALTRDALEDFDRQWPTLTERAAALAEAADPSRESVARQLASIERGEGEDLDTARAAFEEVSMALMSLAPVAPPSDSVTPVLYHVYCPMVKKSWLQVSREIANPYAPQMLRCGSVKGVVAGHETEGAQP